MINALAKRIASYVVQEDDSADFEVIAYGYDLLLQEAGVILVTLLISLPFRLFFPVLCSIVSYNAMRKFTGGAHAKYRAVCISLSILVMFGPSYIFAKTGAYLPNTAIFLLYALDVVLLLLYAPADTEMRPIYQAQLKLRAKIMAIVCLTLFFSVGWYLQNFVGQKAMLVLIVVPTLVCLFTHPWAYKVFGCKKSEEDVS